MNECLFYITTAAAQAFGSHIKLVTSYSCITLCILYGLQPLAMATATDCFVSDIIITDYYVIHICNLEQYENKVTYLRNLMLVQPICNMSTYGLSSVRYYMVQNYGTSLINP